MFTRVPSYREPLFRPPAEADSLIFQAALGCPHNGCRFCGMYKGVAYRVRPEAEMRTEIAAAGRLYPDTRRAFLADGDVMALPFDHLESLLEALNAAFPLLSRVNSYANGSSILSKSPAELQTLRRLKLTTLYLGLESGDDDLLRLAGKRETVADMTAAVRLAQNIGFRCSVMILLGLGGKDRSPRHAARTAAALNAMQPRLLSALRFVPVPGLRMFDGFVPVSEFEAVAELRAIIAELELERTVFRANHNSNPVPLEGRFPADREVLLGQLDRLLTGGSLDRHSPGRLPLFL